jgi:AcrR family transcriptional regulator
MLEEILREYLQVAVLETGRLVAAGGTPEDVLIRIFYLRIGDFQPWHPAFEIIRRESRLTRDSPLLQRVRELARELRQIWIGVFEEGIASGRFRADLEPALMHQIATDVFSNHSVWYRPGGKWSPEQILEAQVSVLFRGIVVD